MAHKGYFTKASANGRSTVSGGPPLPGEDHCNYCLGSYDRCENSPVAQAFSEKSYEGVWNVGRYVKAGVTRKKRNNCLWLVYVVWNILVH